jgi:hypothetical protein
MPSRFDDLKRLEKMLADELITREEFSKLKDELLSEASESAGTSEVGPPSPEPNSDASHDSDKGEFNDSSGLMATVHNEIAGLKAKTLASLHLTEETLKQVDGGDFILKGIFTTGVEAHTRLVLRPESDLRLLVKIKPELLPKAIYMGVIETIDYVIEKFEGIEPPIVVRGFMASYSLAAWNHLVEAGVDFDPGEGKMPGDFFNRLGVADFVDTTLSRSTETSIDPQDHSGSADVIPVTGTNTLGDLGIYQDSLSDEEALDIWAGVPFWKRSVQEVQEKRLFSKRFEWTSQVENRAGGIEAASQGVAKSREESEQAIGEHMTDLAIEFLKKRDLAIAQAAKFGVFLEASRPAFQIQIVNLKGFDGHGVIAKFRDAFMPFIHISRFDSGEFESYDRAMMFLLVLFVVTGDEEELRELMNVQTERQQFRELMRMAKLRRD